MTDKKVLTVQDISCVGQCSITVAQPIISACGVETAILPSAVLSTHTGGFKNFTFHDLTDDIPDINNHWISEGLKFDAVYTGYLGSIRQMQMIRQLFETVLVPEGLRIVDPAMADHGKLYVGFDKEYADAMAELCGYADIILPNITEACFMTGYEYRNDNHTEDYIDGLLNCLVKLGAKKIVLKGISFSPEMLGVLVYDESADMKKYYFSERIERNYHGTGDCYAAAFTGALMQGKDMYSSASLAVDFVVEAIKHTLNDDSHWYGVKFERVLPLLVESLNK